MEGEGRELEGEGSWREERREEQEGRREKQNTIGQLHANLPWRRGGERTGEETEGGEEKQSCDWHAEPNG